MMVGNGATDFTVDVSPSYPETVYNFNLIPTSLYKKFKDNNCFFSFNGVLPESNSTECIDAWNKINSLCGGLDWYDLFRAKYPVSLKADSPERYGEVEINGEKKRYNGEKHQVIQVVRPKRGST